MLHRSLLLRRFIPSAAVSTFTLAYASRSQLVSAIAVSSTLATQSLTASANRSIRRRTFHFHSATNMSDSTSAPTTATPADVPMTDVSAVTPVAPTATPAASSSSASVASATPAPASAASSSATASASTSKKSAGKDRAWSNDDNSSKRQKGNDRAPRVPNKEKKEGDEDAASDEEGGGGSGRLGKKRKVALAVMYRGTAYVGLQLQNGPGQEGQITVERKLLDAVHAAGGVSDDNMEATTKIKWNRAARTDKGVHAAGNIISLMMVCDGPAPAACISQSPDITERINAHLPDDIRVIDWCRTLGGFHAKFACNSRVYEYIVPSFVFNEDPEMVKLMRWQGGFVDLSDVANNSTAADFFDYPDSILSYRLTPTKLASLRSILSHFKGTLNYQNFTRKKSAFLKDAQSKAERPKWQFEKKEEEKKEEGEEKMDVEPTVASSSSSSTPASASSSSHKKENKRPQVNKEDLPSEDEGEGMDDAAEEAFERQQFAARHAAAAAAASTAASSSSAAASSTSDSLASPSPFAIPTGRHPSTPRQHNLLHSHLKAVKKGQSTTTNKVSGQYARFIRYIMDFDVEETYIHEITHPTTGKKASLEFVRFRIHGQSFILNQIRKMIGIVIIVARAQLPVEYLTEKALKYDDYAVPTAPSLGLLLQRPSYEAYDAKVKVLMKENKDDVVRTPIADLFLSEKNSAKVKEFRQKWIYSEICDKEVRTGSAYQWCARLWGNPAMLQHQADLEEEKNAAATKATETTVASEGTTQAPTVESTVTSNSSGSVL